MIGVLCHADDEPVAREFFELFKTPWEFHRAGQFYPVVLCAGVDVPSDLPCRLLLIYNGRETAFDRAAEIHVQTKSDVRVLTFDSCSLPIYRGYGLFPQHNNAPMADLGEQATGNENRRVIRLGCHLFREVRQLLTDGQPAAYAAFPTVDLHIQLLRRLIVDRGIPLIEIPPAPEGHPFIVCLSHDIDQPSIRLHRWDHTMWGFLARALFGAPIESFYGRHGFRMMFSNWMATLKLPLVYWGRAKDEWLTFRRYLEIERGMGSTFFIIPFKNYAGEDGKGHVNALRASAYDPSDIEAELKKSAEQGAEIAVHGLDAWKSTEAAAKEKNQLEPHLSSAEVGVRMHWLFFDANSHSKLEAAGYSYDSTIGYRETIGYRTGTLQPYKPFGVARLLEVPLQVMDTAMFYLSYLNLSFKAAQVKVARLSGHGMSLGGILTVNWHDRSIAAERHWTKVYQELLDDWKERGAWMTSYRNAVAWFRQRREAAFHVSISQDNQIHVDITVPDVAENGLPPFRIRTWKKDRAGSNAEARATMHDVSIASLLKDGRLFIKPEYSAHCGLQTDLDETKKAIG